MTLIESNNNTTIGDFVVGSEIEKDMNYSNYTDEFTPSNYPDLFVRLEPLIDENIIIGDKEENMKLISSYWDDWGNDIYDVNPRTYYFSLFNPQNQDDGIIKHINI